MSEMIEKVARAIAVEIDGNDQYWRGFQSTSRAAIGAMRQPTVSMVQAGAKYDREIDLTFVGLEGIWRTMIDSALSNQGGEG
jgi:hypothetical protein